MFISFVMILLLFHASHFSSPTVFVPLYSQNMIYVMLKCSFRKKDPWVSRLSLLSSMPEGESLFATYIFVSLVNDIGVLKFNCEDQWWLRRWLSILLLSIPGLFIKYSHIFKGYWHVFFLERNICLWSLLNSSNKSRTGFTMESDAKTLSHAGINTIQCAPWQRWVWGCSSTRQRTWQICSKTCLKTWFKPHIKVYYNINVLNNF